MGGKIDSKTIIEVKSSLEREKCLGKLESVLRKAEAASELCKLKGFGYRIVEIRDLPSSYYRKLQKFIMAKLKKKTFFHHVGKVHDLTVENSHTYNVEGKAVHNSAAGALVAYVLGITNLDPIEYDLPFERFMNPSRCLVPGTFVKTPDGYCRVENLKEGDLVIGGSEKPCHVKRTFLSKSKKTYRFHVGENVFECSPNHLWIVRREGKDIEIQAQHILETDKLLLLNTPHHEED